MRERAVVAMSGGVDSSVAAALLVDRGWDVIGITMKLFCYGADVPDRPCCSLDSIDDARRVCEHLGIPHYVVNLERAFARDVVRDFVAEYARGRTPIPCVRCNTFTKFRDLVAKADGLDAPWIATGHYARVDDGALHRGADPLKDQSYFLWGIDRAVVKRLALPVGDLDKAETRARARALGLAMVADKLESQDICFVPDGDHARVIAEQLGADAAALQPGPVVTRDGTVIGQHTGFARFTIGQRRGLPGGAAEARYVVAIHPDERTVVVGSRHDLLAHGAVAREINWLGEASPAVGDRVAVQVRHRGAVVLAEIRRADGTGARGPLEVELAFTAPLEAVTPGQSIALYDGDRLLGGGVIERATADQEIERTDNPPPRRIPLPLLVQV
jgi:tRNA-uridine 2-sulfurtransferase